MTYDPLQNYAGFNAMQFSPINPAAAWNPLTAYQTNPQSMIPGLVNYGGINPQGAPWQNPLFVAQQIAAQQLAQHLVAQQVAQQVAAQQLAAQQQFGLNGQAISPFGQIGVPLAPQSWVGQAGQLGNGHANPVLLAHYAARALQAQGFAPGVGFQA